MDLKNTVPRGRCQTRKTPYCTIPFTWKSRKVKTLGIESKSETDRVQGEEEEMAERDMEKSEGKGVFNTVTMVVV